ncbi:MAG: hypothetical protein WCS72_12675 [Deltaproteobacteria bacterium]
MTWLRKLAPWAVLAVGIAVVVVLVYLGVGYLNSLRSRASEAERKAEGAELRAQGFAVAADTSQKQLDATAAANQLLHLEVERLKKASPGAHVVGTVTGTTHLVAFPIPPSALPPDSSPPASGGVASAAGPRPCALYFDEPLEIRIDGAALHTEGGNLILAGVASVWIVPRGDTETRKILDAPLTLKVQAAAPEKALGWGAGIALVGSSGPGGGSWWAGPIVSPPSVSFLGLDLSALVGGGVGANGAWGGLAGALVRW